MAASETPPNGPLETTHDSTWVTCDQPMFSSSELTVFPLVAHGTAPGPASRSKFWDLYLAAQIRIKDDVHTIANGDIVTVAGVEGMFYVCGVQFNVQQEGVVTTTQQPRVVVMPLSDGVPSGNLKKVEFTKVKSAHDPPQVPPMTPDAVKIAWTPKPTSAYYRTPTPPPGDHGQPGEFRARITMCFVLTPCLESATLEAAQGGSAAPALSSSTGAGMQTRSRTPTDPTQNELDSNQIKNPPKPAKRKTRSKGGAQKKVKLDEGPQNLQKQLRASQAEVRKLAKENARLQQAATSSLSAASARRASMNDREHDELLAAINAQGDLKAQCATLQQQLVEREASAAALRTQLGELRGQNEQLRDTLDDERQARAEAQERVEELQANVDDLGARLTRANQGVSFWKGAAIGLNPNLQHIQPP